MTDPNPAPPPLVPLADTLRLHALVRDCRHRRTAAACGCITCDRDGGALKSYRDCLACVAGRV